MSGSPSGRTSGIIHIIDLRTGRPSRGTISVTLIGDKGAFIDPLAKVPFILGAAEGMSIVKRFGAEALIVDEEGKVSATAGITFPEGRPEDGQTYFDGRPASSALAF